MDSVNGLQRFHNAKNNMKTIILAGRYFASLCKADPEKPDYGFDRNFDDAVLMQSGLDRHFKTTKFNLIIFKIVDGNLSRVFEGNPQNECAIPIYWHTNGSSSMYFGMRNNFAGLPPLLGYPKKNKPCYRTNEEQMKRNWTYDLITNEGECGFVIPAPYTGENPEKPFYRKIKKKAFDADLIRDVPTQLAICQDKILAVSINCDQFGKKLNTFILKRKYFSRTIWTD